MSLDNKAQNIKHKETNLKSKVFSRLHNINNFFFDLLIYLVAAIFALIK